MRKKVALITGGTRGIGLGIARALAKEGYDIAVNGQRPLSAVEEVINELKKNDVDVLYCQGNIADTSARKRILSSIKSHYGQLNILVNNAGVAPKERKDVLDITEDSFDWLLEINLKGTFFMSQEAAKWMIKQKGENENFNSCIVNITSVSAQMASVNRGEYCISKAGLAMMSQLFAVRMSDFDIPVYEIRPGIIATDMTEKVSDKYEKLIKNGLTLEKRLGIPKDVGTIVKALANGDLPYGTGQIINIDGGLSIQRF